MWMGSGEVQLNMKSKADIVSVKISVFHTDDCDTYLQLWAAWILKMGQKTKLYKKKRFIFIPRDILTGLVYLVK